MRVYQPPLAKQSPNSPPSYTLAAAVVAAYLVLVAIVVAVPIVFDYPLEPSTWVRNTKGGRRELPKPKYGVAELAALVANSNTVFPRVVGSNITKIVHQSYKTRSLRAEDYEYLQSWRANHPSWLYQFWTDTDNLDLVETHFPWFKSTYLNLPTTISRADSARYMYMYVYGGVYADLDMESLKPIDPVLKGKDAVLGYMGEPDGFKHNIPNAWMASRPGHPFWLLVLKHIQNVDKQREVEAITGPIALKHCVEKLWQPMNGTSSGNVTVLDTAFIYPFDWSRSKGPVRKFCSDSYKLNPFFDPRKCKALLPNAYTVTYWRHGWEYAH